MKQVILPGCNLVSSRFIFGTASLFNVGLGKRRIELLEAAVENGFTHFDTAPFYGFGMAERDLSHILKRHRSVSLTTKVGIYSPGGESSSYLVIFLRKAAGRAFPAVSRPTVDFNLRRAKAALEGSLRRLGRDYIDLYMLHEPEIGLLKADEWVAWLETLVKSGTIGAFGIAGTAARVQGLLDHTPALAPVVQVLDSLDRQEADVVTRYGNPLQITYGYISAARERGDTRSVHEILRCALQRNREGAIIVSTKRPERLGQYRQILEDVS